MYLGYLGTVNTLNRDHVSAEGFGGDPELLVHCLDSFRYAALVSSLVEAHSQRVHSTHGVECRFSISGITIMIWGSIPHNST